jgi:phospholipase C
MNLPRRNLLVFALATALVLALIVPLEWEYPTSVSAPPSARSPIQHVVEIMMENHAFDNFFGAFPGVLGFPPNVGLPNGKGGFVSPYWIPGNSTPDLPHDRASEISDLDQGKMDGFVEQMANFDPSAVDTPMGYYNATQIGGYWTLAKEFLLCDRYFQPVLGPTLPNRLYAVAGSSAGITTDTWPTSVVYLTTIFDQLSSAGISWRYYYATGLLSEASPPVPLGVAPLMDTPSEVRNVVPLSGLLSDVQSGTLPAVTFVDPSASLTLSEHPPENVTVGEAWSLSVIDALEESPIWNSTAIFLTWDEGGGFYDSVVPPVVDGLGDGFRVPMIVVSPFTEDRGVNSTTLDHTSVLKFIDENWGLPYLNSRVAEAQSIGVLFPFGTTLALAYGASASPRSAEPHGTGQVSILQSGREPARPRSLLTR